MFIKYDRVYGSTPGLAEARSPYYAKTRKGRVRNGYWGFEKTSLGENLLLGVVSFINGCSHLLKEDELGIKYPNMMANSGRQPDWLKGSLENW